jgi:SHS family lactate transporter-like MFS transporter
MDINSSHSFRDEEKAAKTYTHQHHEIVVDERISIREYAVTRITSLKPPMEKLVNPFKPLATLCLFAVSFAG